jgi:hypothetical protein
MNEKRKGWRLVQLLDSTKYIYENKTIGKNMPFPAQNHVVKGVEQNTQMKAGAIVLSWFMLGLDWCKFTC